MKAIFTLHPLDRSDIVGVEAVLESSGLFPPDMLASMVAPYLEGSSEDVWLVARAEQARLGFAYVAPERMTDGCWNMLAIAVDRPWQGHGVGRALVRAAEQRLGDGGQRLLLVETSGLDAYALTRRFYRQLDYAEIARIPDYYQAGEDKIIFSKRLGDRSRQ